MFIDLLLNPTTTNVLEQTVRFTDARQELLADDIVNASTPNYRQKDLSQARFQKLLRARVDGGATGGADGSGADGDAADAAAAVVDHPTAGILFHDGNNRSMEYLMSENAKNALTHNVAVELLRRQYATMDMALKERVG